MDKIVTPPSFIDVLSDRFTAWIGSTSSLIVHTCWFTGSFLAHWIVGWSFDFILLVLTTIVSLEAIYLAIFIQRSVNQQSVRLHEVEETLDDVEEHMEDVEEALDEVEESLTETEEDISEIPHDTLLQIQKPLQELTEQVQRLMAEVENQKKK